MQAVGRIGGYISKSVDTVAAPFHPFGGAVDVIVVLQPDGTYKSNPWYVRFGKFQGVLKTKEKKMITISVNGVEAGFHMYLNHKGEAYFLTEINGECDEDHTMDLLEWTTNLDSPKRKKNDTNESGETFVSCTSFFAETEEELSSSGECVVEQVVKRILTKNRKSGILEEGQLLFSNLDDDNDEPYDECCNGFSLDQLSINSRIADVNPQSSLKAVASEPCLMETDEPEDALKIFNDILEEARQLQSPGGTILDKNVEKVADQSAGTPSRSMRSLHERRRSWPFSFQRSNCIKGYRAETNGVNNPYAIDKDLTETKEHKKMFRKTLTPTSKQLASLNLKEGKNIIVFAFQTAVLGKQQVDARIFMWRWDARIVISDVDGTITRSDLLGQVMPLVGMDWSQMGVAHLFSAIKENGYQILFLSARSIAQSLTTRQFLLSVKQDGVALPDGPVVISPDGLFPSLFREVVRRAPHEFKIACLEDIKALFPTGTNPFCGGFGNRDTDEISYLKVGIPRKKVFIINPKGEISVNRRVETKKAYVSLHALVHDMFPSVSYPEQEEWKVHTAHDRSDFRD